MSGAIVLVVATGDAPYFQVTLPRLQRLARLLSADFFSLHAAPPAGVPPTWLKLSLMERFTGQYERLIVCDADLFPVFGSLRPCDLEPLCTAPAALAVDQGMRVTGQRFSGWCERHFGRTVPEGLTYWNAGLMGYSREVASLLVREFRCFGATPDELFHDQDFINFTLHRADVDVATLPVEMNWMAPQFREATLSSGKIIHFAGPHKSLIPTYAALL